eukprot:g500.t1
MADASGVQISVLSHHEPRPGENTYTRRENGGINIRPNITQLRTPHKRDIAALFDSTPIHAENTSIDSPQTSIRRSLDSSATKQSAFSLDVTQTPQQSRQDSFDSTSSTGNNNVNKQFNNEMGVAQQQQADADKFGMWDGVFARCLLNIFGVIMFLRVPWMVAYAGIFNSLLIIMISVSITGISATSLSAISTNGIVANGGAYYMISRSLGAQFGGAIGLMFYVANAVGCPMYLVGFAETIVGMNDGNTLMVEGWDLQIVGVLSLLFICFICFAGLKYVVKFQLILLLILVLSIFAFIIGAFIPTLHDDYSAWTNVGSQNLWPDWNKEAAYKGKDVNGTFVELKCAYQEKGSTNKIMLNANDTLEKIDGTITFGAVLAVFFPAVTGIMAGANISGDLKDPSYAIPKGTNLALGVSTLVYILLAIIVGLVGVRSVPGLVKGTECPYGGIYHDYLFMAKASLWPPIIYAGIFGATLSSAIASLVGAPRILQAVAQDKLFPGLDIFAKGVGKGNEPIAAYLLTMAITVCCILIGDLNAIAPLITNFFMASYALTNLAVYEASASKSPGWRPTFKFYNKWLSLFGTFLCFGFMLFLNVWMSFFTVTIGILLYIIVGRVAPDVNWGSSGEGARYIIAYRSLRSLAATQQHVKNWRPQLLAIVNSEEASTKEEEKVDNGVIALLRDLRKGHGLAIVGAVLSNENSTSEVDGGIDPEALLKIQTRRAQLKLQLESCLVKGFAEVVHAKNVRQGVYSMLQVAGIGTMRPNTLIVPFKEEWYKMSCEEIREFVGMIGDAFDFGYGVVFMRRPEKYYDYSKNAMAGPTRRGFSFNSSKKGKKVHRKDSADYVKDVVNMPKTQRTSVIHLNSDDIDGNKQPETENTLDVWWLSDDGGLTLLLPHLIIRNRRRYQETKGINMRVMNTIGEDELGRAGRELTRLDTLINEKFRIGAQVCNVIMKSAKERKIQNSNTWEKYQSKWENVKQILKNTDNIPEGKGDEDFDSLLQSTRKKVMLGETIAFESGKSNLTVINVPVPRKDKMNDPWYPYEYMSWLDGLSHVERPSLLVHGSNVDCLTFYS